jgi:hypothetical protein
VDAAEVIDGFDNIIGFFDQFHEVVEAIVAEN